MRVLYLEPFDGGSHAAFTRALRDHLSADLTALTLPGRHWKWRMRGAALWFAERHRADLCAAQDVLLASSFLSLTDLVALVPELHAVPKLLYFHENQLAYPVRARLEHERQRDHHYGLTQLTAAHVADRCLFNSRYNLDSFLEGGDRLLRAMPDARPRSLVAAIRAKADVLPFPVELPAVTADDLADLVPGPAREAGPLILWNQRWEHDKDPDAFFAALGTLRAEGVPFRVAVCGQSYRTVPSVFDSARATLADRIVHWGTIDDSAAYDALLRRAQLVVSTARHEFFGVALIEATHRGAHALVPDRLAYPEIFPEHHRYDDGALVDRLRALCRAWTSGAIDLRADRRELTTRFAAAGVVATLEAELRSLARR